ncbi:MAG TPA: UDP-N-acetylglucosamine 1-carboxyvinyltransferase [Alphaproteobacteria bacterium]|nr:UDP-N-acetylglucosamine 1-carboxyvinyltransferase [Alphaproteobacteria bacterium]
MYKLEINGGKPLKGKVQISGAKNAALPLMAACLCTDKEINLSNVPKLSDIATMNDLLSYLGAEISQSGNGFKFSTKNIKEVRAPYDIVKKMRASVIVLGGLLARNGYAEISLPGGCAIGLRPINLHLMALEKMGAEIDLDSGYVKASAKNGLKGAVIDFPIVSVGATENTLIAAATAKGTTIIKNAAREPEIVDLANLLNAMGAKISGIGESEITIEGVSSLNGCTYSVMPDRIEAGTYAVAGPITGGETEIEGINPSLLESTLQTLEKMGVKVTRKQNGFTTAFDGKILPASVQTEVYPGFPTDMQAQITALMCVGAGTSFMQENIFENRFMHIPELIRMGANINISGHTLEIKGVSQFKAAEVMATDLRASSSLILAGLNAAGKTSIHRLYHLDRGYENLEEKLQACGADVARIKE